MIYGDRRLHPTDLDLHAETIAVLWLCSLAGWGWAIDAEGTWALAPPATMTTTERINLKFDRLTDGTLVAVHQGVAAIVHPADPTAATVRRRWVLAGDGFTSWPMLFGSDGGNRPHGISLVAAAEAAEALGVHLGVIVDGYEIAP